MIRVTVNVPLGGDVREAIAKKLRVKFGKTEILRKSLDARDKRNLMYTYTVAVETEEESRALKNGGTPWERPKNSLDELTAERKYSGARPIVIGAGPCGLFAALTLCKIGAKPIILERGKCVEERKKSVAEFNENLRLDVESNIQFGEGGAGAFSDGKLNTGINSELVPAVLRELVDCGAPEEILYLNKPHVGTDRLEGVIKNIRKKLTSLGAEIHFGAKVTDILLRGGRVVGVRSSIGDFLSDRVYLCIGHSARDTFYMLYGKGIAMTSKVFSMGVRIEHLQENIDMAQYGRARGSVLPPSDYKTAVGLSDGGRLYSFCMCPGGQVVNASSEENGVCVNGMSSYLRDGKNANSALLVNVGEGEYGEGALAGVELQRRLERAAYSVGNSYRVPVQTFGGFLQKTTTGFGEVFPSVWQFIEADLNSILPDYIVKGLKEGIPLIARKIKGFDSKNAVLSGVETRSSSPVRILRDEGCSSSAAGLYPLGEGAGYAGGITSAAADGIRGVLSSI